MLLCRWPKVFSQITWASFTAEAPQTAETSQRGGGKRLLIPSLRSLCVLCASAVNSSVVLLALLSFQLWPFSVKEFLATYLAGLYPFQVFEKVTAGRISCERFLRQKESFECLHCLPSCCP
jgi:hypothetical protein